MLIKLNEKSVEVKTAIKLQELLKQFSSDADIFILNGFPVKNNPILKENDKVVLIKKGTLPKQEELEALMMARHTPGVHEKLKKAKVGIVGLGGLGSNIAISLSRIGVGQLVLVDFDVVEPSNLNRQQYFISDIGCYKTEALTDMIHNINPFIEIEKHKVVVTANNVCELFKECDLVVEAVDSEQTKAEIINALLEKTNKKIVAASGMAGYYSNNIIKTKKIGNRLFVSGDFENAAKEFSGLMAPRVAIVANHQANTVMRLILGVEDV